MTSTTRIEIQRQHENEAQGSLIDVLAVLARHKRLSADVTALAMGTTATVVVLMSPGYTAEVVLVPPAPEQSSHVMMMGSLAGVGGRHTAAGLVAALGTCAWVLVGARGALR